MKKTLLVLLSVINQLVMTTASLAQDNSISEFGKTTFFSQSGKPLDAASGQIEKYETLVAVITAADGSFSIQNLAGGRLEVSAMGDGYISFCEYSKILAGSGQIKLGSVKGLGKVQVNLIESKSISSINPITIITGVIRNAETDEPIGAAKVVLFLSGEFDLHASTRASGQFELLNIPQGDQDLLITHAGKNLLGMISGQVLDDRTAEPLPFANVAVLKDGKVIAGAATDFDGRYKITQLAPDQYELSVSEIGYELQKRSNVMVLSGKNLNLDFKLKAGIMLCEVVVIDYVTSLIDKDGGCRRTVTGTDIHRLSGRGCSMCRWVEMSADEDSLEQQQPMELLALEPSLSLFPIPASFDITLELNNSEDASSDLRILDSSGRIVLEEKQLLLSRLSIPLDGLSDGVYFASVQLKDKLLTERFVVAK